MIALTQTFAILSVQMLLCVSRSFFSEPLRPMYKRACTLAPLMPALIMVRIRFEE